MVTKDLNLRKYDSSRLLKLAEDVEETREKIINLVGKGSQGEYVSSMIMKMDLNHYIFHPEEIDRLKNSEHVIFTSLLRLNYYADLLENNSNLRFYESRSTKDGIRSFNDCSYIADATKYLESLSNSEHLEH